MEIILVVGGVIALIIVGLLVLVARAHRKVPQGKALVRTGIGGVKIEYDSGLIVIPILHRVEEMDISLKTIEVHRAGAEGLICADNIRADIKVVFFVRVNKNKDDILEVAQTIGCSRASDPATLNNLFDAKFSEALKTVGRQFDFESLYSERNEFKKAILGIIGTDLNGYSLDDCAIDYLEQTPLKSLSPDNILDAEGIRKIEFITSKKAQETNKIRNERQQEIRQQDVATQEAILALNFQATDKIERNKRAETELIATQSAEGKIVSDLKAKETRLRQIQNEQEVLKAEGDKERDRITIDSNNQKTAAVEKERIETERLAEIEKKERIVGEIRYDKEKVLENKNREIQSVIKERKAEEKKTIEEEQRILELQQVSEATRAKQVAIIKAQEKAEGLAIEIKVQADTERVAAESQAQKMIIEANALKEKAIRDSEARKIEAEAQAAEEASIGLAEVQVLEARAEAAEKQGMVEARLMEQKAMAEAKSVELRADADRKKGLAEVDVKTANVEVRALEGNTEANIIERKGLAEANVTQQKGNAEAMTTEAKGMAEAKVTQQKGNADAITTEAKGMAEAKVIEQRLSAEAKGLSQKAEAMKLLDGVGRDHEEFKLRLEQQRQIKIAEIDANRAIAEAQSRVLAEAMRTAKIDIVGGETQFFESMMNSITRGKSIERTINSSQSLSQLKDSLLGTGDSPENLLAKVRDFMKTYNVTTESIKNLSIAGVLSRLYSLTSGDDQNLINQLIERAADFGLANQKAKDVL
jgi:flotillin